MDVAGRKSAIVHRSATSSPEPTPWKLLLWTTVAGIVFGLIGFGEIAEDWLRVARNSFHKHSASGDIVFVRIDNEALRKVGRWPWPRRTYAQLTERAEAAGAERIFFDLSLPGSSNPVDDRMFADAIAKSGKVYLAVRARSGPDSGVQQEVLPLPLLTKAAHVGTISVRYNYQNAVWRMPYALSVNGKSMPSFAALMADASGPVDEHFIPDYSVDPATIPTISAASVIDGQFDPKVLRGKSVIIGWGTDMLGDQIFLPGTGLMPGAYAQIIGAETLKQGTPVYFGWIPVFVASLLIGFLALRNRHPQRQFAIIAGAFTVLAFAPGFLEAQLVYADVTPGLFALLVIAGALGWQRYRSSGLIHPVSNLPNLNALRVDSNGRKQALIAARVLNYEEILAALPPSSESKLIEQIASRITVGAEKRTLYHGDGGIFAWFDQPTQAFGNHLEALYALFRTPARVAGLSFDMAVAFGVEVGSGKSMTSRLASALVAADEAAHDGLKWKYYDPESFADASWKLSMLSQLDDAIDRGEVWVAYQPKLDLASRRIVGAEALARWTHPEKGPIAATEFIAAAEQHDRIGKLTDFVLEKAVAAAAQLNRRGSDFDIAVNLSVRLLTDKAFPLRLSALLARHGLAPRHLTLELTETAAMTGNGNGLDMISRLRDLGVRIAIDDYGTGLSTLDYLKKIPADEIKIDQSFVKGIVDNRSDRLMVQSTIGLAQSLGRQVVAEGVEHREILDLLIELHCDIAQGFAVGRPMSLESLAKRLASDRKRSAA